MPIMFIKMSKTTPFLPRMSSETGRKRKKAPSTGKGSLFVEDEALEDGYTQFGRNAASPLHFSYLTPKCILSSPTYD